MICDNCGAESSHIKVTKYGEQCPNCSSLRENRNTDDLMTRNRVRMDSLKHEGDLLPPTRYDKSSKKVVPNEDFIKLNGVRAKNFFKRDELEVAGYSKLAYNIDKAVKEEKALADQTKREVIHQGNASDKIKELLK